MKTPITFINSVAMGADNQIREKRGLRAPPFLFFWPADKNIKLLEAIKWEPVPISNVSADMRPTGKWGIGMNPIYREKNISLAPALCKDCRELVSINENAVLLQLPKVVKASMSVRYSDPSLGQVRRKSVIKTRLIYTEAGP